MNKKGVWIGIVVVIVIILGIGGKLYMDKKHVEEERNQAVKEIQEEVSKYIIANYEGVKKIEWLGWSIGPGPFSIDTAMTINDYEDEVNGKVQFSYSAGHSEWIEKYTDGNFEILPFEEKDATHALMQKEMRRQGVKKSVVGSPNAKVIYNWEESK